MYSICKYACLLAKTSSLLRHHDTASGHHDTAPGHHDTTTEIRLKVAGMSCKKYCGNVVLKALQQVDPNMLGAGVNLSRSTQTSPDADAHDANWLHIFVEHF